MTSHPTGVTVEIVGIEASNNGRSCEEHSVCGSVLCDDVIGETQACPDHLSRSREGGGDRDCNRSILGFRWN